MMGDTGEKRLVTVDGTDFRIQQPTDLSRCGCDNRLYKIVNYSVVCQSWPTWPQ